MLLGTPGGCVITNLRIEYIISCAVAVCVCCIHYLCGQSPCSGGEGEAGGTGSHTVSFFTLMFHSTTLAGSRCLQVFRKRLIFIQYLLGINKTKISV